MGKSKSGIRYYVDSKNRVYAKLNGCKFDAINLINKWTENHICVNPDEFSMKDEYVASVACDPQDEFDLEKGKLIAKSRLLDKYDRDFRKVLSKLAMAIEVANNAMKRGDLYDARRWELSEMRRKDIENYGASKE